MSMDIRQPYVVLTHRPTGTIVRVSGLRSLHASKKMAIKVLRGMLATPATKDRVRTIDIDSPVGSFVRDERTRTAFRDDGIVNALLDRGELGRVREIR